MKTIRVMSLVTVQIANLAIIYIQQTIFSNIHDDTVAKSTEYSYLDSLTKDNNFLTNL